MSPPLSFAAGLEKTIVTTADTGVFRRGRIIAVQQSESSSFLFIEVGRGSMRCLTGTNILKISAWRPVWPDRILTK